jgi:hypothetical protein
MKKNILRAATVMFACGLIYVTMSSKQAGQFGKSQTGCGGNGCHGTAASASTAVNIGGLPALLAPNTTYTLTGTVNNLTKIFAGINVSATLGTFTAIGGAQKTDGLNLEVTHTGPKAAVSGTVTFNFTWTSPSTFPAGKVTFYVAGNAVNATGSTAGDEWNIKSIEVPAPYPASVGDASTQIRAEIAPNLVGSATTISAVNMKRIQIYSIGGTLVRDIAVNGGDTYTLDASNLTSGLYIVKGIADGKPFSTKFTKQ